MKSVHFYGASFVLVACITGSTKLLPGALGEWLFVGSVMLLGLLVVVRVLWPSSQNEAAKDDYLKEIQ